MAGSFRSTASTVAKRFSGIAAASLVAATYAVTPMPAAAVDNLPAQCAKAGNEIAQLKCGSAYYRKMRADAEAQSAAAKAQSADAKARSADAKERSADAKARGAAADARGEEAEKEGVCLRVIMQDLESNGAKTASLTEPPKKGEACRLAKSLKLVVG